ncbi:helix-turn-helix domain-containing protein [Buttiauxella agrestis]|uniref:helix-turn-helix domain-containing protein n=1 Tax=Buttiauxella agrestis TaxID=82977 RepID=UPI001560051D|nr:helix-turn-helix domain-containing protein [Buttiauxella agrestis]BCG08775.1 hypothetical protein BADSM9389_14340 [Buttiauxella agrestis]
MMLRDYISAPEAAAIIGIPVRTVQHWAQTQAKGKPQSVKAVRSWLFNKEEVEAYAAQPQKYRRKGK